MKTKDRILSTSLALFNDKGLSQVTLRTIAAKMGISQGNLNYHFKKRQDIIEALYFQLVAGMDAAFSRLTNREIDLSILFEVNRSILSVLYEYRFLMLDFVQVMRENQKIRQHYIDLQKGRTIQFNQIVNVLQKKGLVREAEFELEFENLYRRMNIVGDFWISFSEIIDQQPAHIIKRYSHLLSEFIYPYLTKEGKKQYLLLRDQL